VLNCTPVPYRGDGRDVVGRVDRGAKGMPGCGFRTAGFY
jgi:hypothetical protein